MLMLLLPLLPVLLALSLFALSRWRMTIVVVLVWTLVEGAVRKWVLPGYQAQVLVLKDIVLLVAYGGFALSRTGRRDDDAIINGVLVMLGSLFVVYCFAQLLNPSAPSMLLALYGLKSYIVYMPLALILPQMLRDPDGFRRVLLWLCLLSIPIDLLAFYQFSQPPGHWINQYVSHEEGMSSAAFAFGEGGEGDFQYGHARTSSSFSFLGGYTSFLVLLVPLAVALLLSGTLKGRTLLLVAAALVLGLGGTFTTGSRAPIYIYVGVVPLMMLLSARKGLITLTTAIRFGLVILVVGVGATILFGSAMTAFEYRAANSDSPMMRILSPVTETAGAFQTSPLIGTGIGTTSNAAASIMQTPIPWWLDGAMYEAENARVMQELGLPGFFLLYMLKIYVAIAIYRCLNRARSRTMIALQLQALVFTSLHLILPTVNNPTAGIFYWAMVGFALAADQCERRRVALTRQWRAPDGYPAGAHVA